MRVDPGAGLWLRPPTEAAKTKWPRLVGTGASLDSREYSKRYFSGAPARLLVSRDSSMTRVHHVRDCGALALPGRSPKV
jgi:hypothetical protein